MRNYCPRGNTTTEKQKLDGRRDAKSDRGAGTSIRSFVRILLFFALSAATFASAADFTVYQWQAVEIPLTSSVKYEDPFQDVEVTATFTGERGQTITRPAFWDGEMT